MNREFLPLLPLTSHAVACFQPCVYSKREPKQCRKPQRRPLVAWWLCSSIRVLSWTLRVTRRGSTVSRGLAWRKLCALSQTTSTQSARSLLETQRWVLSHRSANVIIDLSVTRVGFLTETERYSWWYGVRNCQNFRSWWYGVRNCQNFRSYGNDCVYN